MKGSPEISVVVATHNREERLALLIDALRGQSLPADRFEVVIVDDGSHDDTAAVLEREQARNGLALRSISMPVAGGPARARNRGWQAATAPIVAFTDDDCVPTPEWLATLLAVATVDDARDVIVQGRTLPRPEEMGDMSLFAKTLSVTGPSPHYETCNIAYPRALLERLGGFNERYPAPAGEDTDLGTRAVAAEASVRFVPEALVHHAVHVRGPLAALRDIRLAMADVQAYKLNPGLRQHLPQRVFYRRTHPLFLQALLAVLLARKTPLALAFALPYALNLRGRCRAVGASPAKGVPFYVSYDAAEIAAVVRGAVRHRVPIV
jgi:glycosyltransferase involved in cell wall biosynthesis